MRSLSLGHLEIDMLVAEEGQPANDNDDDNDDDDDDDEYLVYDTISM